ncbi:MAG: hypothetical protein RIQ60_2374 [Pseudomonadota bacterium]|jgi:hypothetical protein
MKTEPGPFNPMPAGRHVYRKPHSSEQMHDHVYRNKRFSMHVRGRKAMQEPS